MSCALHFGNVIFNGLCSVIDPLLTDLYVVVVVQAEEVDVVVVDVEWAEEMALTPVASVNLTGIVEVIDRKS